MKSILFATASLLALSSLVGCAETSSYGGRMDREALLRDRFTTADARDARATPVVDEGAAVHAALVTRVADNARSTTARSR